MTELAWPAVVLVLGLGLLGSALWVFHAWRHPTKARVKLEQLEMDLGRLDREMAKFQLSLADLKLQRELE